MKAKADHTTRLDLESSISDAAHMAGITADLAEVSFGKAGGVTLTEEEASQLLFSIYHTDKMVKDVRALFYACGDT